MPPARQQAVMGWDFPLCRREQTLRLVRIYEKEATLREVQCCEAEASLKRLCIMASSLEAAKQTLEDENQELRSSCCRCRSSCHAAATEQQKCSLRPTHTRRLRLRRRKLPLLQRLRKLREQRRMLHEARLAALAAKESSAVQAAEMRWAKQKLEALQRENAWLRIQWASVVSPSTKAGMPPPPLRPVSPRRLRKLPVEAEQRSHEACKMQREDGAASTA